MRRLRQWLADPAAASSPRKVFPAGASIVLGLSHRRGDRSDSCAGDGQESLHQCIAIAGAVRQWQQITAVSNRRQ